MRFFRRIYRKLFPRYLRLELKRVEYGEAHKLFLANEGKPEGAQWHIAKEEDTNRVFGVVWIERRRRLTE